MNRKVIVLVAAECAPYSKIGGLGDMVGGLFRKVSGMETAIVFSPFYASLREAVRTETIGDLNVTFSHQRTETATLHRLHGAAGVYFIGSGRYFDRPGVYGTAGRDFPDNPERFSLLCRAVLEACRKLHLPVDVFHCNDWHTAILPLYLRLFYRDSFPRAKTLLTIHNLAYQGVFDASRFPLLGLPDSFYHPDQMEFYGGVNTLKAGILHSDRLTTVSPGYAREILTPEFGCGLDGVLLRRRNDLSGVLNGVDYAEWNPSFDPLLVKKYRTPKGKAAGKRALQAHFGLPEDPRIPVFAMVGRLVHQKGVDSLLAILDALLSRGVQLVLLGDGEAAYRNELASRAKDHASAMGLHLGYSESLSHRIYAGADFLLMPSRFEPCGLGQIIALKYGTIPVVRRVGGLADTVLEYDASAGQGWGFTFEGTDDRFLEAIDRALAAYRDPLRWQTLVARAMTCDFSLRTTAREYRAIYHALAARDGA